mgnify:CR=1 FL=1
MVIVTYTRIILLPLGLQGDAGGGGVLVRRKHGLVPQGLHKLQQVRQELVVAGAGQGRHGELPDRQVLELRGQQTEGVLHFDGRPLAQQLGALLEKIEEKRTQLQQQLVDIQIMQQDLDAAEERARQALKELEESDV